MNEISIFGVYKSAWSRLHGSKAAIWSIAILIVPIAIAIEYLFKWLNTDDQALHYWLIYIISPIIVNLAIAPFYGSSFILAIKRARNEEITIKSGYQSLFCYWRVAIVMVIIGLIANLIFTIVNIPLIANTIGKGLPYFDLLGALFAPLVYSLFVLSIPLVIDKNKRIAEALSESFQKTKSHWLRIFAIFLLAYLILFLSYLPAVIGLAIGNNILMLVGALFFIILLIWLLPLLFLLGGDIYHRLIDE